MDEKSLKMIDAVYAILSKISTNMLTSANELETKDGWSIKEADVITFTAMMTSVKLGKKALPPEVLAHIEKASDELVKEVSQNIDIALKMINIKGTSDIN